VAERSRGRFRHASNAITARKWRELSAAEEDHPLRDGATRRLVASRQQYGFTAITPTLDPLD
jgi:hypothetical protein